MRALESWGKVARVQQFRRVLHFRPLELLFGRKWKSVKPCKTSHICSFTPACNKLVQDMSFPLMSLNSLGAGGWVFEKSPTRVPCNPSPCGDKHVSALKVKFTLLSSKHSQVEKLQIGEHSVRYFFAPLLGPFLRSYRPE